MVREKLILITFWKSLKNALSKYLEAKKNYILKMTKKLADSNTSPETYRTMLSRLLYITKLPIIPPLLVDDKLVSDFR